VDVGESSLIKYMVVRCATHFPVAYEAIPVPGQGFDYPCAGDHMIARQLVLRIRQYAKGILSHWVVVIATRSLGPIVRYIKY
jgi:hypothetical protein